MKIPCSTQCNNSTQCGMDPATCSPLAKLVLSKDTGDEPKCVELMQQMLELLPVGVWILDRGGKVIQCNPAGHNLLAVMAPADCDSPEKSCIAWWRKTGMRIKPEAWPSADVLRTGKPQLGDEIKVECGDGSYRYFVNSAVPVQGQDGSVQAVMVVNQDISERVETEETLRSLAETDMLTGANTRRKFFHLLDLEIERHTRYSRTLSAIIFDTDHFKRINDNYGHLVGDDVLMELGRLLAANIRKTDHFCRLGGEEFVILLPETALEEAVASAEKLRLLIEQAQMPEVGRVTCSFGVSQFNTGESGSAFLRRLDQTMYQAKQRGRNQVAFQ